MDQHTCHLLLADWRNRILRLRLATPGYLL